MAPVDVIVFAILGFALLRGLLLGLVRESFSIAALVAACFAVKLYNPVATDWLLEAAGGRITPLAAPWLAGVLLTVVTIAVVVLAGRVLRRGVRYAGLGWADRAAGAVLGTAEGVLVAGILLAVAGSVLGRGHPVLADSRGMDAMEQLEQLASAPSAADPDVAAPPPGS
jgi:membrane protein required for colicin V production